MEKLKKLLDETVQKQVDLVNKMNELDNEKQNLLQEALRLDGEIRVLQHLIGEAQDDTK